MSNINPRNGFSLMELIIVLMIISTILMVSFPSLSPLLGPSASPRKEINGLMQLISSLKQRAVSERKDFTLHISRSGKSLWLTDSAMEDDEIERAMDIPFKTLKGIRISQVDYPYAREGQAEDIYFFKNGYSDLVILQVKGPAETVFLKIEPFLPQPELVFNPIGFDDCI